MQHGGKSISKYNQAGGNTYGFIPWYRLVHRPCLRCWRLDRQPAVQVGLVEVAFRLVTLKSGA